MKLYWSAKQVPGFKELPKADQKAVWQIANRAMLKQWSTWLITILVVTVAVLLTPAYLEFFRAGIGAGLAVYVNGMRTYHTLPGVMERYLTEKSQWSALS